MARPAVRLALIGGLAALAVTAGVIYVLANRGPTPGPLQPTHNVNSFSLWVANGTTMSFMVDLRGELEVTATLDAVSLANPDPGVQLVDAGILDGYPGTFVADTFPLGPLRPIADTTITTAPDDPRGDVFINLGIRVDEGQAPRHIRGVWLDYHIGAAKHRALLPWLLSICPKPVTGTCENLPPEQFSFPPR
jgi:hypothetical protein